MRAVALMSSVDSRFWPYRAASMPLAIAIYYYYSAQKLMILVLPSCCRQKADPSLYINVPLFIGVQSFSARFCQYRSHRPARRLSDKVD